MIDKMRMAEFVEDMCKNTDKKTVKYFMDKYGLTYEEFDMIKYTATPAMSYKARAHSYKARIATMKKNADAALNKLRKVNFVLESEELRRITSELQTVIDIAARPFEADKIKETPTLDK